MRHIKLLEWEKKLTAMFNEVDDYLEDKYGGRYLLHPARPLRGTTSNKAHDGLFNVGAAFSTGLGSDFGPGYVIEVRMVTLEQVPVELRENILQEVVELVRRYLPRYFPDKKLDVALDGDVYKIFGDLKLGEV